MENFGATDLFLFIGVRGCGKSTLCRKIQTAYESRAIIIFDSLYEYSDSENVATNFNEFTEALLTFEKEGRKSFTLVYQFDPESSGTHELEFEQALRVLYYRGECFIVIEEVQQFSSAHGISGWFKTCLFTGRHRGLGMAFTVQRPGELNKGILSQCKHVYIGSLFEKNDIDYCRAILGDLAHSIPNLAMPSPNHPPEFIYYSPSKAPVKINGNLQIISSSSKPEIEKPQDNPEPSEE